MVTVVRLALSFTHCRPEPVGVEIDDIDAVASGLEAIDGTLGESVGIAVRTGMRENDGGMHGVIVADGGAQLCNQPTATSS